MVEKDIKYITISEEHAQLLKKISDNELLTNKHDIIRAAILIALKIDASYELSESDKKLTNRSQNKKAQNFHSYQVDGEGILEFMIRKLSSADSANIHRKMQALAHLGLKKIKQDYLTEEYLVDWIKIKEIL